MEIGDSFETQGTLTLRHTCLYKAEIWYVEPVGGENDGMPFWFIVTTTGKVWRIPIPECSSL